MPRGYHRRRCSLMMPCRAGVSWLAIPLFSSSFRKTLKTNPIFSSPCPCESLGKPIIVQSVRAGTSFDHVRKRIRRSCWPPACHPVRGSAGGFWENGSTEVCQQYAPPVLLEAISISDALLLYPPDFDFDVRRHHMILPIGPPRVCMAGCMAETLPTDQNIS